MPRGWRGSIELNEQEWLIQTSTADLCRRFQPSTRFEID
jgi:hypothetical protein